MFYWVLFFSNMIKYIHVEEFLLYTMCMYISGWYSNTISHFERFTSSVTEKKKSKRTLEQNACFLSR